MSLKEAAELLGRDYYVHPNEVSPALSESTSPVNDSADQIAVSAPIEQKSQVKKPPENIIKVPGIAPASTSIVRPTVHKPSGTDDKNRSIGSAYRLTATCVIVGLVIITILVALSSAMGGGIHAGSPTRPPLKTMSTTDTTPMPAPTIVRTTTSEIQDKAMIAEIRTQSSRFSDDLDDLARYSQSADIENLRRSAVLCLARSESAEDDINDYHISSKATGIRSLYSMSLMDLSSYCENVIAGCDLVDDEPQYLAYNRFSDAKTDMENCVKKLTLLQRELGKWGQ